MIRKCAWCGDADYGEEVSDEPGVTHGICPYHMKAVLEQPITELDWLRWRGRLAMHEAVYWQNQITLSIKRYLPIPQPHLQLTQEDTTGVDLHVSSTRG